MECLTLAQIAEAASGEIIKGKAETKIKEIAIDSREVKEGDLFIAIIGENNDGHQFIESALQNGAKAVIVDRPIIDHEELAVIKVADTTKALQDIAHYYRMQFKDLKVAAVTGSAGKTSTKDMTAAVLAQKYKTLKTLGNYNNQIGLPLTLLRLCSEDEFAVLEMGMSGFGEIKLLAELAQPQIAIITNVGPAHIEQLGSIENVALAKRELLDALDQSAVAILNYDNKYTKKMAENCRARVISFGFSAGADLQVIENKFNNNLNQLEFKLKWQGEKIKFYLNKAGKHNIYNALAAIAVAFLNGMSVESIQAGLNKIEFSDLRMDIKQLANGAVVINDSYNANPISVRAAVDVLLEMKAKRKIAVLASMLELGAMEKQAHLEIGEYIAEQDLDLLITVGEIAELIAEGARKSAMAADKIYSFADKDSALKYLKNNLKKDDLLLVKGSRSNQMEKIVAGL
ncbi:UDP-N-acetylmuramoyl-tripeptide--D-alanyl-D-alanine ligase [Halanaerobium sp. Z-7514]|uniref:UDP-N-acetylmuramoyl-tripeptide--D-alanyl-D-alanine ligase n=1 Tax=Halanaerobium polyolivorans TaxID=2886943 RepID=A0AAW4WZQ5_9FIRM|nr:UDP-N-acetylmuramoyl-tripeptide--D-alanyl-D-alanine ligase [Halanaerobium polyolivorans]MCC3144744.1 UDP-N-acetylmuramoyl-tripeptide--D-alanyl-D-alanine ligase [Halanaerobium polyolivorans]